MEKDGTVLVIRRIHVVLTLKAPAAARETVERVHAVYKDACPVYRSLEKAIAITSEYRLLEE